MEPLVPLLPSAIDLGSLIEIALSSFSIRPAGSGIQGVASSSALCIFHREKKTHTRTERSLLLLSAPLQNTHQTMFKFQETCFEFRERLGKYRSLGRSRRRLLSLLVLLRPFRRYLGLRSFRRRRLLRWSAGPKCLRLGRWCLLQRWHLLLLNSLLGLSRSGWRRGPL